MHVYWFVNHRNTLKQVLVNIISFDNFWVSIRKRESIFLILRNCWLGLKKVELLKFWIFLNLFWISLFFLIIIIANSLYATLKNWIVKIYLLFQDLRNIIIHFFIFYFDLMVQALGFQRLFVILHWSFDFEIVFLIFAFQILQIIFFHLIFHFTLMIF